jgi:signal transduction histidine kinase
VKGKSLTTQTVLVALAAQLVCAALLCGAALLHEWHTRMHALDTQIQGRSDSLLGAVQDAEDPDANVTLDPAELKLPPRDVFAVYNQGGRLLGSSPEAPVALTMRAEPGFREVRTAHQTYRILQRDALRVIDRAEHGGVGLRRPVTIVYAMPEDHLRHEVFEAASFYIVTILLATGGVAFLLPTLLRRTLRPLADLASATSEIQPPLFPFSPPASAIQLNELRPLAEVLNLSISRVRSSFAREQQFVSDAAHELKTAVAVVRSSAQLLLLRRRSESEYAVGLDGIVKDVERLESLISQMLQLARGDDTLTREIPQIDLGKTAQNVADRLTPIAEQRKVSVVVEATAGTQIRLRQDLADTVVSNILLNALQHSTAESSPVLLSVFHDATGEVKLRVVDGGAGISPEALPHIFERFFREDRSRSRNTGGTGLGLAITKSIVDSAKGEIEVESTPGVGTTMQVTFRPA